MQTQKYANPIPVVFQQFNPRGKEISDIKTEIGQALRDISSAPELITRFSEFVRRFHQYSFYNMILIFLQCPSAVQVAGFHTWRKLGRWVKRGEHGIAIFAPLTRTIEDVDDDTGEKTRRKILRGFKLVSVFDYSQTDGTPLQVPPIGTLEMCDPVIVNNKLFHLAIELGLKILEVPMDVRTAGRTNGTTIWINRLTLVEGRCMTLLHEIGHVLLGHSGDRREVPRAQKECEAELTSFLVAVSLGVPKGSYEYIRNWANRDLTVEEIEMAMRAAEAISGKLKSLENGHIPEIEQAV